MRRGCQVAAEPQKQRETAPQGPSSMVMFFTLCVSDKRALFSLLQIAGKHKRGTPARERSIKLSKMRALRWDPRSRGELAARTLFPQSY